MMLKGEKMAPRTMNFMQLIVVPRGLRFWSGGAEVSYCPRKAVPYGVERIIRWGLRGGKANMVIAIAYSHGGAVRGRAEGGSGQT
jgi:hypothetical protein